MKGRMELIPKFRAYWINEKRWFRDDIIITDDGHMWNIVNGELYDVFDRDIERGLLSLMQSTGFTDDYGVEIYEGDIITYECDEGYGFETVKTKVGKFPTFDIEVGYRDYDRTPIYFAVEEYWDFKVIGNIYDHPHLLEGGL